MTSTERRYDDGEIIFREGEISDSAFVIVDGNIKITKSRIGGTVALALLEAGELFGEMGVLDKAPRSATATAVGDVTLTVIAAENFLEGIANNPSMALSVMERLVQRLRAANTLVVRSPAVKISDKPGAGKSGPSWLQRLLSFGSGPRLQRLDIWVAKVPGENGQRHTSRVVSALGRHRGVRVRPLGKVLAPTVEGSPGEQFAETARTARTWLDQVGGDLLIWGQIPDAGLTLRLRFVSAAIDREDRPGIFDLATALDLPLDFGPEFAPILRTAALAALTPQTEGKKLGRRRALFAALEGAIQAVRNLPQDLTAPERASIQLCHGNALATASADQGSAELYRSAVEAYRSAADGFGPAGTSVQGAIARRQQGAALQALAEFTEDVQPLETASDMFRLALKDLTREAYPWEWAATQNRLGSVLFKIYLRTQDTEMLKRSLAATQESLQVVTRRETPSRWAEVMVTFAQSARELGEHLQNTDVLEKAADACRAVLEVRTREDSPYLWAATQVHLGSTLFFLGKINRTQNHVLAAAYAFEQAHDFYEEEGATKMVSITRKNIERLHPLLATLPPNHMPKMTWEDAEE